MKRNKTHKRTTFAWEQLNEKQAYEKICQALREGAPELRRRMLKDIEGGGKLRELEDKGDEGTVAEEIKVSEYKTEDSDKTKKETKKTVSVRTRSAVKEDISDDIYAI